MAGRGKRVSRRFILCCFHCKAIRARASSRPISAHLCCGCQSRARLAASLLPRKPPGSNLLSGGFDQILTTCFGAGADFCVCATRKHKRDLLRGPARLFLRAS